MHLARSRRPVRPRRTLRAPLRLVALLTAMLVLLPIAASALEIEDYAPYRPQTKCSPTAKPGTKQLARWLQSKYDGSGSLGISRTCGVSGVSEHKEGRAFDWAVDHSSTRDRGYVKAFLAKIFATDKAGNPHALARRMGIMYLIWNDHIYSSYRSFEARPYLSSSCPSKSKCSVTLRHRNHVHISLSRKGGRGDTSWYHRHDVAPDPDPDPDPDPEPDPDPVPVSHVLDLSERDYIRVAVPTDGSTRRTRFTLREGRTYQLTAAGLFTYGRPDQVADASCAWSRADQAWRKRPQARERLGGLNLLVNGSAVFDQDCRGGRHVYRTTITPKRTQTLGLRLSAERDLVSGGVAVTISRPGRDVTAALPDYPRLQPPPASAAETRRGHGLLAETVVVAADRSGASTRQELRRGVDYRVTVSGSASLGRAFGEPVLADARCVQLDAEWYRQASLDRRRPAADHGNLYLDGVAFTGRALGQGCADHQYVAHYSPDRTGRLRMGVWDPLDRSDNTGALTVRIQRLTPWSDTPTRAGNAKPRRTAPWRLDRDWFKVHSARAEGTVSTMRLRRDEQVRIVVRGRQRSHGRVADAACVRAGGSWQPTDPGLAVAQDPLELWVDGTRVEWRALGRSDGCSDEHAYAATYVARHNGPVRLAVLDLDHRDNAGALEVTLLRGK